MVSVQILLRLKILKETNLTLERVIDICRANKAMVMQTKTLAENKATTHAANLMEICKCSRYRHAK